tara:strand:+ start:83 stop:385 length:303 start_codon:yes stop_codon:yes gene_type:complete
MEGLTMKILKSKVAGMTDLQYTKRHNLIKQVAKKRALEAARDAEMVREEKALERQLKKEGIVDNDNHNINHWTDGPQYLEKHYGARLADQNHYESDEGWN